MKNLYCIQASLVYRDNDTWKSTIQVPTFFLDGDIQGILNEECAEMIAREIICPVPNPAIVEINITATKVR